MENLTNLLKSMAVMEKCNAIETYGEFNSLHEAFAIALEEWQEAKEELQGMEKSLNLIWARTRRGAGQETIEEYKNLYHRAICAAAECTQIAAVCLKLLDIKKEM